MKRSHELLPQQPIRDACLGLVHTNRVEECSSKLGFPEESPGSNIFPTGGGAIISES